MNVRIAQLGRQAAEKQANIGKALSLGLKGLSRLRGAGGVIKNVASKAKPVLAKAKPAAGAIANKVKAAPGAIASKVKAAPSAIPKTVVDTAKGIPQTAGAMTSLARPVKAFKHYRDAAGSMRGAPALRQVQRAGRNLLRDTAGISTDPFHTNFKHTSAIGDALRTLWNPRVPTARGLGTARPVGSGVALGRPISAYTVGSLGVGAAGAADRYIANQPITGNQQVDALLPRPQREQFNRDLFYKHMPKTFWSGITNKNPVDSELVGEVFNRMRGAGTGALKNIGSELSGSVAHSGKKTLYNQTVGRALGALKGTTQRPLMDTVNSLRERASTSRSNIENSQAYASMRQLLGTLDPGDSRGRMLLAKQIGGELGQQFLQGKDLRTGEMPERPGVLPTKWHTLEDQQIAGIK